MYLEPVQEILDRRNQRSDIPPLHGIYESDATRSLVLLVDFKGNGEAIWPVLHQQLQPLRDRNYLAFFNGTAVTEGPVTIVASGDVSFRDVIHNSTHRDVFYDAPLELMDSREPASLKFDLEPALPVDLAMDQALPLRRPVNPAVYSTANSYYASVSFTRSIGYPWGSQLTRVQVDLIRAQVRGAHERGLKVRYWDVPVWPLGVRNYLWRVLVREGVDYLSLDDIRAAVRGDWGPRKGGWYRKWWT